MGAFNILGQLWLSPLSKPARHPFLCLWIGLFLAILAGINQPVQATTEEQAKQIWQLLDYVAVDYEGAVKNGSVLNEMEYQEMQEFTVKAEHQLNQLPNHSMKATLQHQAIELRQAVTSKAELATVRKLAHSLANEVQKTYPFPVAPKVVPDMTHGAKLFQAQCAACHGVQGKGDGKLAASLNPKPIDFTDHGRARERSIFALHQVITNGVPDTSMQSYGSFSEADRWALAFFVGTLAYTEHDQLEGAKLWQSDNAARKTMISLDALTQNSEQALSEHLAPPAAKSLIAYLRSHPTALEANASSGLSLAQHKLTESVLAVKSGDRDTASKLALSAYLDGFEPVEPMLAIRDHALFEQVEAAMIEYRNLVTHANLSEVQVSQQKLSALLHEVEQVLSPAKSDAAATFVGALTILLREGVEALLVVVGMLAFLKKAERRDMIPYVHIGWVTALLGGGLTWAVATYFISISGASRELTEGFSSLFASLVLLGVGMWMHQKSVAGRWQIYLKEKLSSALNKRAAWFLFLLAFVAVYREVFETVLFYTALWADGNGKSLLAGLGLGIVLLAGLAVILLRTSARLPIGQFFAVSSLLVSVLAIVLAGKGIAGLQEAGLLSISSLAIPRVEFLGLYPSWETFGAQLSILLIAIVAFFLNQRSGNRPDAQRKTKSTPSSHTPERTMP